MTQKAVSVAERTLNDMRRGEADVIPYKGACDWCPYQAVCRYDKQQKGCRERDTKRMTIDELLALAEGSK